MKHKHFTLFFVVILLLFSTLLVPTLRTNVNQDFMLSIENDVTQFENSSFVLQPLWNIGQKSERIRAVSDDEEIKVSTTTINRTTTIYLYQIHIMILLVIVFIYTSISYSFYNRKK